MTSKERLLAVVMEFMKITQHCYENTTYAEDRTAYASDIVLCAKWLSEMDNNVEIKRIIDDILDTSTSKHILDYYKQGKLGNEQASGFVKLEKDTEEIRQMLK